MVSLDGFFEGPKQEIDWHVVDDEFNEYADELLQNVDTLLFGRVTYQLMADYWPTADAGDPAVAEKMNNLPKIVFSKTLDKVDWKNTRIVKDDIVAEISRLKAIPGKDLVIFGSSDLAVTLIQKNLIDEYRIIVNPVILGGGKPLFRGINRKRRLRLLKTRTFRSGCVCLYYAPEAANV